MKKRVLAVLLSTAMVASLAIGCGSNSKSDDTKSETKTEEKTDTKEETKDVESVEQRTVYVTPEWLKSAQDGNQEGYEDVVVAEDAYGDNTKAEDLLDKAKNFVSQYNSVLGTTKSMNSYSILQTAVWGTEQMNLSQGLLNKVGITINDDNTLSLDETKFKAANMSDLKALFSGSGSLADRGAQKASSLYNQSTNQFALNQGKSTYTMFGTLI